MSATIAAQAVPASSPKLRVGVIGLGVIAPYFLRAVDGHAGTELTAVCDLRADRLESAPAGVTRFRDHHALLDSGLVDAVVLTLPNNIHADVAADAFAAGVHVCCEKPLAIEMNDARRLADLAAQTGLTLFTAFHRRYNVHVRRLADELAARVAAGAAGGGVASVRARYHERIEDHSGGDAWYLDRDRCGGGCLIDNGPNALDAVRQLVGDLTVVDATIGDVRGGVEFRADVELVSDSGIPVTVELDWALPTGEVKDIEVRMLDGTRERIDMLAGFTGFKSSLEHEYAGIIDDFVTAVREGRSHDDGPALVDLVESGYRIARAKERRLRMSAKAPSEATLVKLLFHRRGDRGMELSEWRSRCVQQGELHEIVTTTDRPQETGDRVDQVGFIGFAKFVGATVVERGDSVSIDGRVVGTVAGFDECHYPNHYNIVIDVDRLVTAEDLDLSVGDPITFKEAAA